MGLCLACVFLLYFAVLTVVFNQNVFEAEGGTVGMAILLYLTAGAVGGCFAGMLLPLARTRLGAAMVGMPAIAPYFVLQSGILFPAPDGLPNVAWWEVGMMSVAVGGVAGYLIRDKVFPELDAIYEGPDSERP